MTIIATSSQTPAPAQEPVSLSVVICVHDAARLPTIRRCLAVALDQLTDRTDEVIVVADHAHELGELVRAEFPGVRVLDNQGERGLAAARNVGSGAAHSDVVVYLDDDAVPRPGWAAAWREVFADPSTVLAGGRVEAAWPDSSGPAWFPPEFGWVVGCDYRGLPTGNSPIRNPIGANMAVRRDILVEAGGFTVGLGRVAGGLAGCEETELGIRIRATFGPRSVVRDVRPVVDHQIARARTQPAYFLRRCLAEGRSKAALTTLSGTDEALDSERSYVVRTLPAGFAQALARLSLRRAAMLVVGFAVTTLGFLLGKVAVRRRGPGTPPTAADGPVSVDLDLRTAASTAVTGPADVLVRLDGLPLGRVRLRAPASGEALREFLAAELGEAISLRLSQQGAQIAADAPPVRLLATLDGLPAATVSPATALVSVVICTLGREPRLRETLRALLAQSYRRLEIVVVDNDPASGGIDRLLEDLITPGVGQDVRVIRVPEPRRGLSVARNTGWRTATGKIVAFTDDDAVPDARWVEQLAAAFELDPGVAAVTGLVMPSSMAGRAEALFEQYGGFDKGNLPQLWSLRPLPVSAPDGVRGPLFPYATGQPGSGNNMAFRREILERVGGFDPALGAGTPTRGGEDLDMFTAVLCAGGGIFYTPAALVRHHHRADLGALRKQIFGYGSGMAAVVTKQFLSGPRPAWRMAHNLPGAFGVLLRPDSVKNQQKEAGFPISLTAIELLGYAAGPVLLAWSRARTRNRRGGR